MADEEAPTTAENTPENKYDARPWRKMIEHSEKTFQVWNDKCDNMAKDYANLENLAKSRTDREFQMFYANMEVVKPSIYSRPPQPVVVQRFKDAGRAVARKAGEMLERALVASFDTQKVHETLKRVRDDLALCGRGQVWLRYETYDEEFGSESAHKETPAHEGQEMLPESEDGEAETQLPAAPVEKKPARECNKYDWVHRKDFLHDPARVWTEVGWVARRAWLTDEKGKERFGKRWTGIKYEDAPDTSPDYKVEQKAAVWELWHKEKGVVVWIHMASDELLDIQSPHLRLEGFFPCPRPAYGTCEPDSLIPVPDACFYKDQLEEINELTARISALSESLRLQVFYPSGAEDLGAAIELAVSQMNAGQNKKVFIPLPGMASMAMGGGKLVDMIWTLPVADVAQTVKELVQLRRQLIEDVYQISGISDIMRGQTEASETLGAQQLKSQYGSIRIKDRQAEMVAVADGCLNISGEIMAENFSAETLIAMSQTEDIPRQADILQKHQQAAIAQIQQLVAQSQQPGPDGQPPQPMDPAQFEQAKNAIILKEQEAANEVVTLEKVFDLLKSQRLRPFVLQIATDSTIQPDENAEKAARNEFGQAFAQITTALGPLLQADPGAAPFAGEMLKFMLAPFRAGRQMDQAIDEFVENAKKKSQQPPPPNPEMIKAEAEAEARKQDAALKAAEMEDRKAERAEKNAATVQAAQAKAAEVSVAANDKQAERAHKERMAAMELEDKRLETRQAEIQLELKRLAEVSGENAANAKLAFDREKHADMLRREDEKIQLARDQLAQKDRDMEERRTLEREKRDHDMNMRERDHERAEASKSESERREAGAREKPDHGMDAVGRGLEALAAVLGKPKKIVRGPDGRSIGVE